jgi:hypothetical protein
MENKLEKYLIEACGKNKEEIPVENPYRIVGFDGESKRLGWMRLIPFFKIEQRLREALEIIKNKDHFIFIGIGGSGNGIKALLSLFDKQNCYTLDSLDPLAVEEIVNKIKTHPQRLAKTLVVPISKSGTTKETQLLAQTLREVFSKEEIEWEPHFLWLADRSAFVKLDSLGWAGITKLPIQFDDEADIGGRFSCPHTMIFYLPLLVLLDRDLKKIEEIYLSFNFYLATIRQRADEFFQKYKDEDNAFFAPVIEGGVGEVFFSWIVQLFQESLGSKRDDLSVKTLPSDDKFLPLKLGIEIDNPVVHLMCQMYFFQVFTAFFAAAKSVNFVNQDFVEKYKAQLRKLESEGKKEEAESMDLNTLIDRVRQKLRPQHRFIEIVLFLHPKKEIIDKIKNSFRQAFSDKDVLVFIGSDWNHHSYQAAFGDKNTFFVCVLAADYKDELPYVSKETLAKNVEILKLISRATYLTIEDKSFLCSLQI